MIDLSYYRDTFHGRDASDDELTRYISRAQDIVMSILAPAEYEDYDSLDQAQIDKAVAYQVEYLVENGDVFSETGMGGEKVGGWSVSGTSGAAPVLSPMVQQILSNKGLVSRAVEVGYASD